MVLPQIPDPFILPNITVQGTDGAALANTSLVTNEINQSVVLENVTQDLPGLPGNNYTWSDPPLNTTHDNPYYLNNQSWVINESGHNWIMDLEPANNTNYPSGIQFDGTNTFSGFGFNFAILINASNVIFDGMGAILNGGGNTEYGIIVNNQSAANYNNFGSSPSMGGISITNITLTGFKIAGIFFNNVIGDQPLDIVSNITHVNASGNLGSGIVLSNSANIEVSNNHVYDNLQNGILLQLSSNNNVSWNEAINNTWSGVNVTSSADNRIDWNNLTYNREGLVLANAWNNTLTRNNASYNNEYGYLLNGSWNNSISGSTVRNNTLTGILLTNSSVNNLTENIVINNRNGIVLNSSNGNTLTGNNASYNTQNGIILTNSSSNILFNNTVSRNTWNGIFLNHRVLIIT